MPHYRGRGRPSSSGRGRPLSLADLPPPDTRRWVARRKAQVVAAVQSGVLELEEACRRYSLSTEEYAAWAQSIDRHGPGALRVTRLRQFRQGKS